MKKILYLAGVVGLGLWVAACGGKATIEGTVLDTLGNPLDGAAVTIEGSTAVGMSDSSGKFSVSWVPGETLKVVAAKIGYLSHSVEVQASEAGTYDVGTIELQPQPPDKGLWLWDNNVFTRITDSFLERGKADKTVGWCLPANPGDPTPVPGGDVVFFDWSDQDRHLVRLDEKGCAGTRKTESWLVDDDIEQTTEELRDDMYLRKAKLTPGRYVYADWTGGFFSRGTSCYFVVK